MTPSPAAVDGVRTLVWAAYLREERQDSARRAEHEAKRIRVGAATMHYEMSRAGEKPAVGWPLYIALHGGGGAPAALNGSQWRHMAAYYRDSARQGIYVAPRGIGDTWNLHFLPASYPLYDLLIEDMILFEDVDPDRVYLLGYSAGGDGVYQIVPRTADRWAAAAMSAGHHNGVDPRNFGTVPLLLQVGERDAAYGRNKETVRYASRLDELRSKFPESYVHELFVHRGRPHNFVDNDPREGEQEVLAEPLAWLDGKDGGSTRRNTNSVAWLRRHVRDPLPRRVTWDLRTWAYRGEVGGAPAEGRSAPDRALEGRGAQRYWLDLAGRTPQDAGTDEIVARIDAGANAAVVDKAGNALRILLRRQMLDLSRPVEVRIGRTTIRSTARPNLQTMVRTLLERGDPRLTFDAEIAVWRKSDRWEVGGPGNGPGESP